MKKYAFFCVISILCVILCISSLVFYLSAREFCIVGGGDAAVQYTALCVKVCDLSGQPVENAAVYVAEAQKIFYTGADGCTAQMSVPIAGGAEWGSVTLVVVKEGFVDYVLYNCVVYNGRVRNGPVIRLFDNAEESPDITVFSENPPDDYSMRLAEYVRALIRKDSVQP